MAHARQPTKGHSLYRRAVYRQPLAIEYRAEGEDQKQRSTMLATVGACARAQPPSPQAAIVTHTTTHSLAPQMPGDSVTLPTIR